MTDVEWLMQRECGLVERDGSTYACTLCGKKMWVSHHYPWPYRCLDCDPNHDWFWSHYFAWESGYELGLKTGRNP